METSAQAEATGKQETPVCAACRTYGWKVQFPGEFPGKYYLVVSVNAEAEGRLCILHYCDNNKDLRKCLEAVEEKKKAKDFNFRGAWFPCDVEFAGELENADFSGATFSGAAYFYRVTFGGAADFVGATFGGEADFLGATFGGAANFSGVTFKDRGFFVSLARARDEKRQATDRKVRLRLTPVFLEAPEKMQFQHVDMAEVALLDTDVRKIEFTDVQWPKKLRDEREATREQYPLVEELYRQLRRNYEDNRNYPDAGRFYHGEMEMRRKAKAWPQRCLFSLTALYWLSSGYGQKPWRAGLVSLLLFMLFGGLYMLVGLQEAGAATEVLHSASAAFLHAAEVLTFARERTYAAATDAGRWLSVIQTVVLPLQVAMLVLAIRRAFRR